LAGHGHPRDRDSSSIRQVEIYQLKVIGVRRLLVCVEHESCNAGSDALRALGGSRSDGVHTSRDGARGEQRAAPKPNSNQSTGVGTIARRPGKRAFAHQ
jgi:hypothetical protein